MIALLHNLFTQSNNINYGQFLPFLNTITNKIYSPYHPYLLFTVPYYLKIYESTIYFIY